MLEATGLVVGAYLYGAVPFALLIGLGRGSDIRTVGSGNVGATNLGRAVGTHWGVLAFFCDAAKGYLPVFLGGLWLGANRPDGALVAAGVAAVVGHCYSPYLGFRGGKGVATTAGVLLALHPLSFAILISVWVVVTIVVRDIGVASSVAAGVGLAVGIDLIWGGNFVGPRQPIFGALLVGIAVLILFRHRSNIREYWASRGGEGQAEEPT